MKISGTIIKTSSEYNAESTYYLVDSITKQYYKFHKTMEAEAILHLSKTVEAEVHTGIKFVQKIY